MTIDEKLDYADSVKAQIEELHPNKQWNESFLRSVKYEFTYVSNKLEGNVLTYGQTIQLLQHLVTPKNAPPGALLDIINHQKVLDSVFANFSSKKLSVENIKSLHWELMKNPSQWADDGLYSPGQYKSFENMTVRSSGKIHQYMHPSEVASAMGKLVEQVNNSLASPINKTPREHILFTATFFHQIFLNKIHPFSDGNGRIARIFMNLLLLQKGYPPIFITEVDKDEYLRRFELSDTEIHPMLDFMCDRLIESLERKMSFIKNLKV